MAELVRSEEHDEDYGMAYLVNSPIRLDQFDAELSEIFEVKNAGLSANGNTDLASPGSPATLYVGLKGAAPTKVVAAGAAHVPDPEWFAKTQPTEKTFRDVAIKASQGGLLTSEEIQVALRGLLSNADI